METLLFTTADNLSATTTTATITTIATNTTVQTWWLIQLVCRLTLNKYANSSNSNASGNLDDNYYNDRHSRSTLKIAHNLECLYKDDATNTVIGGTNEQTNNNDDRQFHRLYYRCSLLKQRLQQMQTTIISAECESTDPPLSVSVNDREIFDIETDFPRNVSLKLSNDSNDSAQLIQQASVIWLTLPKFPYANFDDKRSSTTTTTLPIFREARLECYRRVRSEKVLSCTFGRHSSSTLQNEQTDNDGQTTYDWIFLFVVLFIAAGGVGNVLVCLAVCMDRRLQNVTNYFLLSLAIADLLVCLFVMPLGAIQGFFGYWPLGIAWCNVYVSCDVLACSSSIMHMCCISLGRYLGIRNPLKTRHKYATKRLVGMKVALVWALSFAVSGSVTFLGLHNPRNIMPEPRMCVINNRAFFVFGSLVAFYIPMLIMVVTYALTVQLLRKKARFLEHKTVGGCGSGETSELKGCDNFRRIGGRFRKTTTTSTTSGAVGKNTSQPATPLIYSMGASNSSTSIERLSQQSRYEDNNRIAPAERKTLTATTTSFNRISRTSSYFKRRLASTSSQSQTSLSDIGENLNRGISTISETMRTTSSNDIPTSGEVVNSSTVPDSRAKRLKSLRLQLNMKPSSFRFLTHKNKRQNVALGANAVRTEQKASKVLGLVFFTFVSCWTPFFALNILFAVCPRPHCPVPDHIVDITLWLGYVSSTINPIIYTIFNRTFRNAFVRLLQMNCKKMPNATTRYRIVNDNRGSSALFSQIPTSSGTPTTAVGLPAATPFSLPFQSVPSLITPPSSTTPAPASITGRYHTVSTATRMSQINVSEVSEPTTPT